METVEKITRDGDTQIFEIITSKKELREWIRLTFWDCLYSEYKTGIWEYDDDYVVFYDIYGKCHSFFTGDEVKRFNIANIDKMVSGNDSTTVIYGNVPIVYNEHYGDWDVDFD